MGHQLGCQSNGAADQAWRDSSAIIAVAPLLLTIAISYALARAPPPVGSDRERVVWWIFLLAVTLSALYLLDKLFRRFAPLATLLQISLVFPDEALGASARWFQR